MNTGNWKIESGNYGKDNKGIKITGETKEHKKTAAQKKAEHKKMAHRYLLQYQGYEESAAMMENRYVYSVLSAMDKERQETLLAEFHAAQKKKDIARERVFKSLHDLADDKSRTVLWMIYIERKASDEAADWMGISIAEVRKLKDEGLQSLRVPDSFCEFVRRMEMP